MRWRKYIPSGAGITAHHAEAGEAEAEQHQYCGPGNRDRIRERNCAQVRNARSTDRCNGACHQIEREQTRLASKAIKGEGDVVLVECQGVIQPAASKRNDKRRCAGGLVDGVDVAVAVLGIDRVCGVRSDRKSVV